MSQITLDGVFRSLLVAESDAYGFACRVLAVRSLFMHVWPRRALALAVLAIAVALAPSGAPAATPPRVTVITRNLYLGTDLLPLAAAAPGAPFRNAVAAALAHVEATDPTARMKLIAKEIANARPDLVGLQEASIWTTGPLNSAKPSSHVVVDYLKIIIAELKRLHASYRIVAERLSLHLHAPSASGVEVGFTDGSAVLARSGVNVSHVHSGDFKHQLKLATAALGAVTVTRNWNELDATAHGARFHFVNTQLEAYSTSIRLQQAQGLVAGPLKSSLQTILVGDLNSSANLPSAADRPPYLTVRNAGFAEERTAQVNCCFNDDLRTGKWDHIVDHIMAKPAVKLVSSTVTGRETTAAGRHPSDHGGVVSVLQLP